MSAGDMGLVIPGWLGVFGFTPEIFCTRPENYYAHECPCPGFSGGTGPAV